MWHPKSWPRPHFRLSAGQTKNLIVSWLMCSLCRRSNVCCCHMTNCIETMGKGQEEELENMSNRKNETMTREGREGQSREETKPLWRLLLSKQKEDVKANEARAELLWGGYDDPHVPGMSAVHKPWCWKSQGSGSSCQLPHSTVTRSDSESYWDICLSRQRKRWRRGVTDIPLGTQMSNFDFQTSGIITDG